MEQSPHLSQESLEHPHSGHSAGPDTDQDAGHAEPGHDAGHVGHGYVDGRADYVRRLKRIEGQTRGLQRMVESDQYCIDILTQVSAVTRALESFALAMLEDHLRHCVARATVAGGDEAEAKITEASAAIARLVRS